MTLHLAKRLDRVRPSATLAITAQVKELQKQGISIISFGAGEPDFDTPTHIKEAAARGLETGVAKYTVVTGIEPLRQAVADTLNAVHGVSYGPSEVIVSCGAKHSIFNLLLALIDDGDEVIIPAPYWVSYPEMVRLVGGVPVIIDTRPDSGFMLDPGELTETITSRTKAIILNSPSNPTGALYSRERLQEIASVAVASNLWVISDDIYRSLVYGDNEYVSIASLNPDIAAQTILVDGVSKTYAMTGWRIGYTAGPKELIAAMSKVQGQSTSNPTHISQVAALAALTGPQDCVATMRAAFDERRLKMVELLRAMPDVSCRVPEGAFYAFPDLSAHIGRRTPQGREITDDLALAGFLVDEARIAVVPGSGFGAPGFARLSYACSMADIETGLARMHEALSSLR